MALPSFLNQTCLFLLHGNAGCAEGTADTAIQGAVSHDSAGSLLADQAVGPSGVKQTATAASVCTAELVPFGGFVDIASHFGGDTPQNPNFWGVNRRFQAKRAKY